MKFLLLGSLFIISILCAQITIDNYGSIDLMKVENIIKIYEFEKKAIVVIDSFLKEYNFYYELMNWRCENLHNLESENNTLIDLINNSNFKNNKYLYYFITNSEYIYVSYAEGGYCLFLTDKRIREIKNLDPKNDYLFLDWLEKRNNELLNLCEISLEEYCNDFSTQIFEFINKIKKKEKYKILYRNEYNKLLDNLVKSIKNYRKNLYEESGNYWMADDNKEKYKALVDIKFNEYIQIIIGLYAE